MNYQVEISDLLENWLNETNKHSKIVDFLVEWLTCDPVWTVTHITASNKQALIHLCKILEDKEYEKF